MIKVLKDKCQKFFNGCVQKICWKKYIYGKGGRYRNGEIVGDRVEFKE